MEAGCRDGGSYAHGNIVSNVDEVEVRNVHGIDDHLLAYSCSQQAEVHVQKLSTPQQWKDEALGNLQQVVLTPLPEVRPAPQWIPVPESVCSAHANDKSV